jgi:antitoxin ParD1/3/4
MMVSKFTSTEGPATMPTRNVNLTHELDRFVAKKVKTGRYENASEVVRAGLRTLEREEQQYEAKFARFPNGDEHAKEPGMTWSDIKPELLPFDEIVRRVLKSVPLDGSPVFSLLPEIWAAPTSARSGERSRRHRMP